MGVQVVLRRIALAIHETIGVGSARYPEDGATFEELLEAAKSRAVGAKARVIKLSKIRRQPAPRGRSIQFDGLGAPVDAALNAYDCAIE